MYQGIKYWLLCFSIYTEERKFDYSRWDQLKTCWGSCCRLLNPIKTKVFFLQGCRPRDAMLVCMLTLSCQLRLLSSSQLMLRSKRRSASAKVMYETAMSNRTRASIAGYWRLKLMQLRRKERKIWVALDMSPGTTKGETSKAQKCALVNAAFYFWKKTMINPTPSIQTLFLSLQRFRQLWETFVFELRLCGGFQLISVFLQIVRSCAGRGPAAVKLS